MPGSERADFVWGRKLGAGTFGCVYSVLRHADGQRYCIKEVDVASLPRREQEGALKEVRERRLATRMLLGRGAALARNP
eukprot:scaffold12537_cov96-Isochrysis_galbana.AAC.2